MGDDGWRWNLKVQARFRLWLFGSGLGLSLFRFGGSAVWRPGARAPFWGGEEGLQGRVFLFCQVLLRRQKASRSLTLSHLDSCKLIFHPELELVNIGNPKLPSSIRPRH